MTLSYQQSQSINKIHAGGGRISVSLYGSRAVFSELSATYPLKLLSPRIPQDRVAVAYILSYGGGLVGGDRVNLSVDVQPEANLVLLSQGSTKVFKTRKAKRLASAQPLDTHITTPATLTIQNMHYVVARESALFLLPDPVTCFKDASYTQTQRFDLAENASLVLLDWITSGRKSLGEDWVFSRYYSVNEIFVAGKRAAKDVMLLEDTPPVVGVPTRTLCERLAPYACYAMVLLYGPKVQEAIVELENSYNRITVFKTKSPADLIWSFSAIQCGKGAVIRVAGLETEVVKKWLNQALIGIDNIIGTEVYRQAFS